MIPVLDRSHLLALCKDADKVGLVVESAVIAYLRCAQRCIYEQITRLGHTKVIYISDERDSGLLLEEVTESGI
jgi:hypothetical protein